MNLRPVYSVNTQVVFTPDSYNIAEQIMAFAVEHDCWVQIRGTGSQSSVRVAGSLDNVEHVYNAFMRYEQSCFNGRCDKGFCDPNECSFTPMVASEVPLINMSGMPL